MLSIKGEHMKRLLLGFIFLAFLISNGNAGALNTSGNLYFEATKGINSGIMYGIPVLEWNIQQKPFMIDIEFRNNFTSPRGKISFPNHYSSQLEVHLGQVWGNAWATFSLGGEIVYAGNDFAEPAGVKGLNTLRMGVSF
jgi:hypothetical protein